MAAAATRTGWRDRIGAPLRTRRALAALELLVVPLALGLQAAGIVAKPKLPLLLFGWLSMWLRRVPWRTIGFARPASWPKTLLLALAIGLAYDALDIKLILPLLHRMTGEPIDLAALGALQGNAGRLALLLAASWISAAFPEELLYRGYLLNRVADVSGRRTAGWAIAVALVSVVFAAAHRAQGASGVADNLVAGVMFAGLYLGSGRNLWLPILVHGVIDSASVILLYLGYRP